LLLFGAPLPTAFPFTEMTMFPVGDVPFESVAVIVAEAPYTGDEGVTATDILVAAITLAFPVKEKVCEAEWKPELSAMVRIPLMEPLAPLPGLNCAVMRQVVPGASVVEDVQSPLPVATTAKSPLEVVTPEMLSGLLPSLSTVMLWEALLAPGVTAPKSSAIGVDNETLRSRFAAVAARMRSPVGVSITFEAEEGRLASVAAPPSPL
jgi:hypothetical protein